MAQPRVYFAEEFAIKYDHTTKPLDGTLKAAQSYVDAITRSVWWKTNCEPSWLGDQSGGVDAIDQIPKRVIVKEGDVTVMGEANLIELIEYRKKFYPSIVLGKMRTSLGWAAIADPWIILHELAHIMAASVGHTGHRRPFCIYLYALVKQYLGDRAALSLLNGFFEEGLPAWRDL